MLVSRLLVENFVAVSSTERSTTGAAEPLRIIKTVRGASVRVTAEAAKEISFTLASARLTALPMGGVITNQSAV